MRFPLIRQWLIDHAGLEPLLLVGPGFESLVSQRLISIGAFNESQYVDALDRTPGEVDRLTAGIAVPETWLFRYPRSFESLVQFLQKRRAFDDCQTALRMCSIGCATGQEPYCMAMGALQAGWPADRIQVDGIDRNGDFLRIAADARLSSSSIRTEIPSWAMSYLRHDGDGIDIDPIVRNLVRFRHIDVSKPKALEDVGLFDVIFCRNLLIYLKADTRDRLLESIIDALIPGGMLFVGHAEQMIRGTRRPWALRLIAAPHAFALERVAGESPDAGRPPHTMAAATVRPNDVISRARPTADTRPILKSPAAQSASTVASQETLDDARALADAGRTREVEPIVRSILARRGPSAQAFELLGLIRMTENDADGAKRLFEQAVYLEPGRSTSLLQLAMISERAGDGVRASMFWERAQRASIAAGLEARR